MYHHPCVSKDHKKILIKMFPNPAQLGMVIMSISP